MSDSALILPHRRREVADGMHLRLFTADSLILAAGRWNAQNVRSAFWRFYQNQEDGAFLVFPDGGRFPLTAGRVYFVPAGVRFSCGNGAAFRHFYIHFDVVGLPRLTLPSLFDGPIALPYSAAYQDSVSALAASVAGTATLYFAGQCRAKALVYEGLARYLESLPETVQKRAIERAAALEPVAPALEHIEARLADALPVPELAALCCLSADHFARRFKDCVGLTPGGYIQERRLTRAAQFLLFSDRSLDAIAAETGFGNRNYLTRRFTQALGVPPAAYRKKGAL